MYEDQLRFTDTTSFKFKEDQLASNHERPGIVELDGSACVDEDMDPGVDVDMADIMSLLVSANRFGFSALSQVSSEALYLRTSLAFRTL